MNSVQDIQTRIEALLSHLGADQLTATDIRKVMTEHWRRHSVLPSRRDDEPLDEFRGRVLRRSIGSFQNRWDSGNLMIDLVRGNCCAILFAGAALALFLVRYPHPPLLEFGDGKRFSQRTLHILTEACGKKEPDLLIPPELREEWILAFDATAAETA